MSSSYVVPNDLKEMIENHLKNYFRPVDPLPEDFKFAVNEVNNTKACFLIKNSFFSNQYNELFIQDENNHYPCSQFVLKYEEIFGDFTYYSFKCRQIDEKIILVANSNGLSIVKQTKHVTYDNSFRDDPLWTIKCDKLFDSLKNVKEFRYKDIARLFSHFNHPCNPRIGEFIFKNNRHMYQEFFKEFPHSEESMISAEDEFCNLYNKLDCWVDPYTDMEMHDRRIDDFMSAIGQVIKIENGADWPFRAVIPFYNECGFLQQVLLRVNLIDPVRQNITGHCYLPFTFWRLKGTNKSFIYPLPLPEGQILFNLDKLHRNPEHYVILTSSVALAASNARHPNCNITWTSWLGGIDGMPDVDWTPLRGRTVFVAVHMPAPDTLDKAYLEAELIEKHLSSLNYKINIGFVEIVVDYRSGSVGAKCISDLDYYRRLINSVNRPHKPNKLRTATVMTNQEFDARMKEVSEFLHKRELAEMPFDHRGQEVEADDAGAELDHGGKSAVVDYLFAPLIEKNTMTCMYAEPGCGKTAVTLSICGAMISGNPLFAGGHWCVPQDYQDKICCLYLNYERTDVNFNNKVDKFLNLTAGGDKLEEYRKRFKFINVFDDEVESVKFQMDKVIQYVNQFRKDIGPDKTLVVVFDNYASMLGKEESQNDWKEILLPLVKYLKAEDITSILVDHANVDNDLAGRNPKKRAFSKIVNIESCGPINKNLNERSIIICATKDRNNEIDGVGDEVCIRVDKAIKKWVLYDERNKQFYGKDELEVHELKSILLMYVHYHTESKLKAKDIPPLLGMSYNTYRNKITGYIESRNKLVKEKNEGSQVPVDFDLYEAVDELIGAASTKDAKALEGKFVRPESDDDGKVKSKKA